MKVNLENIESLSSISNNVYDEIVFYIVKNIMKKKLKITAAESLTAGMFLSTIADISGASNILDGGFITYSNDAKKKLLNIDSDLIDNFGVVSNEIAQEMANKSRSKMNSDIGVGLTGVAGPNSLEGNPKGRVFIGLSYFDNTISHGFLFCGDRELIRRKSVLAALLLIDKNILEH